MADTSSKPQALIVGAGTGLSAAFARRLAAAGYAVHLAARNTAKLEALAAETGARLHVLDGTDAGGTAALIDSLPGDLRVACYNPSARLRGPVAELDPEAVRKAVEVTAYGAFVLGQAAAKQMLTQQPADGRLGTILFTGASAGVKGFAQSAAFAMGKFAQRGLAQSMARELHPKGIHVAWVNIDGGIRNASRPERTEAEGNPDSMLDPDAIASEYMHLIGQHRSAWSDELVLRPWVERF
ncbi:SDR family NAD(P)-dependent oxidoreductase [Leisingera aquaemixtae]|uniref:SDR family NAD(P)-dependent oxidoreductase n=1 Tax=Leisingera aquaemixtae TaxID=1396826 RepID=UPI001C95EEF8|nr:SDR family NAD(P)-dependent oxidoreductase [Leisingera aquaemixtae]MBY6066846.1 SDR family NAD(P)-dependent oxidoreductase [Leisingera aquaemixtae]